MFGPFPKNELDPSPLMIDQFTDKAFE